MVFITRHFGRMIVNSGPLFLLYYLSISEIDTEFSNIFEILSFNIQIIIIYYWMIREASILGNGHVFFAGIINDVIMGLPLGLSAISYLAVSFVANYVKAVTVNFSLFTDWFTFLIAIFFSNLVFLLLMLNFSDLEIVYSDIFYNAFFTFLFFPFFWFIFNLYKNLMVIKKDG
jgi:cell shape-determining protein MreD